MQGVSSDTNTIRQYCSVCKDEFEMEVIKQGSKESVLWLKCPGCQGFLPYMPEEDGELKEDGDEAGQSLALEDLDVENAKEYSEASLFEIGDIIHHRSWNDYGKILSKESLPGNRRTIWVQFVRQGKVQLLEGVQ